MLQAYRYEPLPDRGAFVRLLEVLPGKRASPLRCRLSAVYLHSALRYAAISYHWGPPPTSTQPERTIWIDGKAFRVRANCYHALRQVRLNLARLAQMDIERIWIDSICIDQKDIREKGAQVQIMSSHIYPMARCVLISLSSTSKLIRSSVRYLMQMDWDDIPSLTALRALLGNGEAPRTCLAFGHLSYWKRLWILPEVLTASDLHILCGSCMMHWSRLQAFLDSLQIGTLKFGGVFQFEQLSASPLWKVFTTKLTYGSRLTFNDLETLLESHGDWECSDPRDRIYAFTSMIDWPGGSTYLPADYGMLSRDLAARILRMTSSSREKDLGLVCCSLLKLLRVVAVPREEIEALLSAETEEASRIRHTWDAGPGIDIDVYNQVVAIVGTDRVGRLKPRDFALDVFKKFYQSMVSDHSLEAYAHARSGSVPVEWRLPKRTSVGDLILKTIVNAQTLYPVLRLIESGSNHGFKFVGTAEIETSSDVPELKEQITRFAMTSHIATSSVFEIAVPMYLAQIEG